MTRGRSGVIMIIIMIVSIVAAELPEGTAGLLGCALIYVCVRQPLEPALGKKSTS